MELNLSYLKDKKNLLAFSAGVDSTALFFLLHEQAIEFDIAIVDYGLRNQSKEEVAYAKELASRYNKKIYTQEVKKIKSNFEHKAREIRYEFFEHLMQKKGYDNLITAHQLDDKFEWFMMQLSRGAGLNELLGFEEVTQKKGYKIIKPLLHVPKDELLEYLSKNGHKYYIDESNADEKYKRNYFRKRFTKEFLNEFSSGVKNSFAYLQKDKEFLNSSYQLLYEKDLFKLYEVQKDLKEYVVAKTLKELGYVMSAAQRQELNKSDSLVIGKEFAIGSYENLLFICKYSDFVMDKKQKEKCRVAKIPKHCRPYLCEKGLNLNFIKELIQQHTKKQS